MSSVGTARGVLPDGDLEEVVCGEHLGKTAVVCDQGCDDADVSSSFLYVELLHHKACVLLLGEGINHVRDKEDTY